MKEKTAIFVMCLKQFCYVLLNRMFYKKFKRAIFFFNIQELVTLNNNYNYYLLTKYII